MTYNLVQRLILAKKKNFHGEDWRVFVDETKNKLDVFLLANRITSEQYEELNTMLNEVLS